MNRPRLAIYSLGCKLNQAEGEAMLHSCALAGYEVVPFEAEADVYVVNTCTVTHEADREGRRLARKARRQGPRGAKIILAGCAAQANAAEMRIPEADLLLGNAEKLRLSLELEKPIQNEGSLPELRISPIEEHLNIETVTLPQFGGRTRAYLKVQDGCDFSCTFCASTIARGVSRSLPPEDCAHQARQLAEGGRLEIVLTGVHLGAYGRDLAPRSTLSRLLKRLLETAGLRRLRLSSVEPGEITRELVRICSANAFHERAARSPYVCRHFHVPVQSGDDGVLEAMGRNYSAAFCAGRFAELAEQIPGVCLGGDFIAGFPGESPEAFAKTLEWVRESPLAYLHVFPYSPRPGTAAAEMGDTVPPAEIRERVKKLQDLGRRKWAAFVARQEGRETEVLFEGRRVEGVLSGLADNYVRVFLKGPEEFIGQAMPVRLSSIRGKMTGAVASRSDGFWGTLLG
ncbi:MAG: tRNA (N(6)-L-threonylcarbamoyladenosine(37)-C(2))-methylthiotransferase MtaB [bacterium]|nr:tRNA (N(6)-L-threonylcarbamoyladenosine(37)-C(2))-methylthiotransferase MtaB [bacterium]